jgi:AraC-like DNA-binding protein
MPYRQHIPSAPLHTYIDDLYYLDGPAPYRRLKVFPMPSVHLIVNLGDGCQVYRPDQADPYVRGVESCCVGLWSSHHVVEYPTTLRVYGIHFKPGGASPFLRMPLSELHDAVVALDDVWGQDAEEIRERLYDAPTIDTGFALLQQRLMLRLTKPTGFEMVRSGIAEIERQHGAVSIRGLAEGLGTSQNHLGVQFKRLVGVPPKQLARSYRFAHMLQTIDPEVPVDWAALALETRFYDQSHFNKEFSTLTGFSPTRYLQLRRRLQSENREQARSLGQMLTE